MIRRRSDGPPRILVCSAAGLLAPEVHLNVGDEALTTWLAGAIASRLPGARVEATLNPGPAGVEHVPAGRVPVRPYHRLAKAISRSDIVVLGGGTLLQEDYKDYPILSGLLRYVTFVAAVAKLTRVPTVFVGVGVEALTKRNSRRAARAVTRSAAAVSVRDEYSARLLEQVAGRKPIVGSDVMFLSGPPLHSPASPPRSGHVVVSLRGDAPDSLVEHLAQVLEKTMEDGGSVSLVATHRDAHDDPAALERLRSRLPPDADVTTLPLTASWKQILDVMAVADVCVGMRLHFLIFAALLERRTVALTSSSTPKSMSFVNDLGLASVPVEADAARITAALAAAQPPDPQRVAVLRERADLMLAPVVELAQSRGAPAASAKIGT